MADGSEFDDELEAFMLEEEGHDVPIEVSAFPSGHAELFNMAEAQGLALPVRVTELWQECIRRQLDPAALILLDDVVTSETIETWLFSLWYLVEVRTDIELQEGVEPDLLGAIDRRNEALGKILNSPALEAGDKQAFIDLANRYLAGYMDGFEVFGETHQEQFAARMLEIEEDEISNLVIIGRVFGATQLMLRAQFGEHDELEHLAQSVTRAAKTILGETKNKLVIDKEGTNLDFVLKMFGPRSSGQLAELIGQARSMGWDEGQLILAVIDTAIALQESGYRNAS